MLVSKLRRRNGLFGVGCVDLELLARHLDFCNFSLLCFHFLCLPHETDSGINKLPKDIFQKHFIVSGGKCLVIKIE